MDSRRSAAIEPENEPLPCKFRFPFSLKDKGLFVQREAVNSNIKLNKGVDKPYLF